jgi:hypothetical protein
MDVLTRIRAGNRTIDFALATTRPERAAVLAQRFRVYQRKGYYRPGLHVDRDLWDQKALYFLALLLDEENGGVLLGSARLIRGELHTEFRFPVKRAFELELPAAVAATTLPQRIEVSRVVAEAARGVVIGGLLIPLGLIRAICEYAGPRGVRAGLAVIKQRLLRALQGAGVALHQIQAASVVYPRGGPLLLPLRPGRARVFHRGDRPLGRARDRTLSGRSGLVTTAPFCPAGTRSADRASKACAPRPTTGTGIAKR